MPTRSVQVRLIAAALFLVLIAGPNTLTASGRICAPTSMIKVVTSLDVPGAPHHPFVRVPKTLYRYGEGLGRVEESANPETGLHLLFVIAEPHVWVVDQATRTGKYQRDPGPTYLFRAKIFSDPNIQSAFINSLEFGCETAWLIAAGATTTRTGHPTLGLVDRLVYRERNETLHLYARSGHPVRLELHRPGGLYVAVQYLQYESNLPLDRGLFERPVGVQFSGEGRR